MSLYRVYIYIYIYIYSRYIRIPRLRAHTRGPMVSKVESKPVMLRGSEKAQTLPIGPKVVPFWGSYLESYAYKVIPKGNHYGAYGYRP